MIMVGIGRKCVHGGPSKYVCQRQRLNRNGCKKRGASELNGHREAYDSGEQEIRGVRM